MKRIYFDNASTNPIDKRVLKEMKPYLTKYYGNPSSLHQEGHITRVAIYNARKQCAIALGCDADEIFFTSGASESNSWASEIWDMYKDPKTHDSLFLNQHINNTFDYAISLINNETGQNDYENLQKDFDVSYRKFFLDLTQAVGHIEINLHEMKNVFGASLSGHKFGAPKGVGLLYVRKDKQQDLIPLIRGHQENGLRGGTENVVGIVGMGKAIELATQEMDKNNKQIKKVVEYIKYELNKHLKYKGMFEEHWMFSPVEKVAGQNHIINITFKHLLGATAVQIFDQYGIAVSAGSACNSDSETPSHTLLHSAYTELEALRTIRISIGKQNTSKEAQRFIKVLKEVIDKYDVD